MSAIHRDAARLARLISVALLLVFWASCKSHEGPALGGETNWLAWCQTDAQCESGTCVCGVCTAPCSAEEPSCAAGDSSCFARGSFAHASLCAESSAEGICLPVCATDVDCREGSSCQLGACLPISNLAPSGAPGNAAPSPDEARRAALAAFSNDWLTGVGSIAIDDDLSCSNTEIECLTLEQLLSRDSCYTVSQGCGIYYVSIPDLVSGTNYWYEGFGAQPIGGYRYSDVEGSRGVFSSRSLECDVIETMCSTCGAWGPPCRDMPEAFPEPLPPAPPPGCSCEPDGEGAARISLDCFCSLYECPASVGAVVTGCNDVLPYLRAGTDACGRFWFEYGVFNPVRFAFEATTGELVAATVTNGSPVTGPCNTYELRAGADASCETASTCYCGGGADSCDGAMWFGLLQP